MNILNSVRYRIQYALNAIMHHIYLQFALPNQVAFVDNELFNGAADSDISDHLNYIFSLALAQNPRTILELGTRGGESTKVLTLVAELSGSKGYSVDLSDAPSWLKEKKSWTHFVADDTLFIQNLKDFWPNGDKYKGVDILFLDTSHIFDHTLAELNLYWDQVNSGGILILHDTNCTAKVTRKLSGKSNRGWDNQRGVIRAVEEFFNCKVNENVLSSQINLSLGVKSLTHFPWNNGLTVIFKE